MSTLRPTAEWNYLDLVVTIVLMSRTLGWVLVYLSLLHLMLEAANQS
mgnify:CR=1 FL=1